MLEKIGEKFMRRALELAHIGMKSGYGGPFGAVIVKDNKIISEGYNTVTSKNDPTAHAEIIAIRKACQSLNSFHLSECEIYCSCEPCPMCLGAIYWARIKKIYFASDRHDASKVNFDDNLIYSEINLDRNLRKIKSEQLLQEEGSALFKLWIAKSDKSQY